MTDAVCAECGSRFKVPARLWERHPDWTPRLCPDCYAAAFGAAEKTERGGGRSPPGRMVEENLTLDEILRRYTEGPKTGVFTDGSAQPNPGPGGWGAVYVVNDEVVARDHGHEPATTNNRMELTAVIRGVDLVPAGTPVTIYTDSKLVHDTLTKWAAGWERRGWRRKTGPVQNLDLVREAYGRLRERPEIDLEWVPGHAGYRWNEYADSLSTAYLRDRL